MKIFSQDTWFQGQDLTSCFSKYEARELPICSIQWGGILSSSVTGFIFLQWLKLWSVTYAAGTHLITKMAVVAAATSMTTQTSVL